MSLFFKFVQIDVDEVLGCVFGAVLLVFLYTLLKKKKNLKLVDLVAVMRTIVQLTMKVLYFDEILKRC